MPKAPPFSVVFCLFRTGVISTYPAEFNFLVLFNLVLFSNFQLMVVSGQQKPAGN
jgi:hypothetical protein